MGLADWFSTFCSNITVPSGTTGPRYRAITQRLNTDFWTTNSDTAHSRYVGSFGRGTANIDSSDVDVLFQLPYAVYERYNNYVGNGQSALLQEVRDSLKKTYSSSKVDGDGQVVVIQFTDNRHFEVLPAFINKDASYTYPDSNAGGSWKTTDPVPEIGAMKSRNSDCNNNLFRLCRMMRAWKQECAVSMSGMLIDTLAYQFLGSWEHRKSSFFYYDFMCRDFFAYVKGQDKTQKWWLAPGRGRRVYASAGSFQYKATRGYNIACEAITYELADPKREWSAKQKWREIFGTRFPS